MSLIQLTLDEHQKQNHVRKTDYEQELVAIWENHVKTESSGVYVCSLPTEPIVRRQYRRKKKEGEGIEGDNLKE